MSVGSQVQTHFLLHHHVVEGLKSRKDVLTLGILTAAGHAVVRVGHHIPPTCLTLLHLVHRGIIGRLFNFVVVDFSVRVVGDQEKIAKINSDSHLTLNSVGLETSSKEQLIVFSVALVVAWSVDGGRVLGNLFEHDHEILVIFSIVGVEVVASVAENK